MVRDTSAERSMASESASRTRLSSSGFLPLVPVMPGVVSPFWSSAT
jgi:hypothetical protein